MSEKTDFQTNEGPAPDPVPEFSDATFECICGAQIKWMANSYNCDWIHVDTHSQLCYPGEDDECFGVRA